MRSEGSEARWLRPRSARDSIAGVVLVVDRRSFVVAEEPAIVEACFPIAVVAIEGMTENMVVGKAGEARRSCEPDSAADRSQTFCFDLSLCWCDCLYRRFNRSVDCVVGCFDGRRRNEMLPYERDILSYRLFPTVIAVEQVYYVPSQSLRSARNLGEHSACCHLLTE